MEPNSVYKTTIAKNIKYFRNFLNMDQTELAKKINVGRTTISNYETGISTPDIGHLKALSNCFGIPIDNLCEPLLSYEYKQKEISVLSDNIDDFFNIDIIFPKVFSDKATEDTLFKQAYIKHQRLLTNDYEVDIIKEVDKIYALYKESFEKNKTLESACNMISLMMLEFCCKFMIDSEERIEGIILFTSKTIKEIFVNADINEDNLKEKQKYFLSKKKEYIMLQKNIRKSIKYRNFSDFYFALCYNIGFIENSNSITMNKFIFLNLIGEYITVGNRYAIDYYKMFQGLIEEV